VKQTSRVELWDIITRDMENTLLGMREHAARAVRLSAQHPPSHPHQKSWKKAIMREQSQADKYEAAIVSREHERPLPARPEFIVSDRKAEYLEALGLWFELD